MQAQPDVAIYAEDCPDKEAARDVLRGALRFATPSRAGWSVVARFRVASDGRVHAAGQIRSVDGVLQAEREVVATGTSCTTAARAIGVWASLVLDPPPSPDAAPKAAPTAAPPAPPPVPPPQPVPTEFSGDPVHGGKPVPPVESRPRFLPRYSERLEFGSSVFAATATGRHLAIGPSLSAAFAISPQWALRPWIGLAAEVDPERPSFEPTWFLGRVDFCHAFTSPEVTRLTLDLCGGAAGGAVGRFPVAELGPATTLRGLLGAKLWLDLRWVAGLNLARAGSDSDEAPPWFLWRMELGLTWSVR